MKGDFWFVLLSHTGDIVLSGHVTRAGPAPMSRHVQPRSRKPELLAPSSGHCATVTLHKGQRAWSREGWSSRRVKCLGNTRGTS